MTRPAAGGAGHRAGGAGGAGDGAGGARGAGDGAGGAQQGGAAEETGSEKASTSIRAGLAGLLPPPDDTATTGENGHWLAVGYEPRVLR